MLEIIQKVLIWAIPILFAITLHEAAHGYVANKLGDKTALLQGRITLNPFRHIDLFGTIIVPVILLLTTSFIFGWAKPVPVNVNNLNNPKRDFAFVALAGPMANLLMALMWALLLKIITLGYPDPNAKLTGLPLALALMSQAGIIMNLLLGVLNLIPIPPLDGSRIMAAILPTKLERLYYAITPFGFFIILALALSGILGKFLLPIIFGLQSIILQLFMLT